MKLGADPEFFIRKAGKIVAAHSVGIRGPARKHIGADGRGKFFRDGFAVELNPNPTTCRQTLANTVAMLMDSVARVTKGELVAVPAVRVDPASLADAPADVRTFGCNPSYCAYEMRVKTPDVDAMRHPWRYSGGHMHFGIGPGDLGNESFPPEEDYPTIILLHDKYVGLPLTCIFHSTGQYQRRKFYGQAGEFRPQRYGMGARGLEYRTPGPEMWNHPAVASLAFGAGRWVVENYKRLALPDKIERAAIRRAINTGENRWALMKHSVPNVYSPARIHLLAERADLRKMQLPSIAKYNRDEFGDNDGVFDGIFDGINEWAARFAAEKRRRA